MKTGSGNNFWVKLKKPIFALAPMAGITDSAFRQICKSFGADVVYSELASVTALFYNPKKTLGLLKFCKAERPYVAQLFGNNPEHFAFAVKIISQKLKPDGIDINFGCPAPKVRKQGAGAALMNNLELSHAIIKSVIDNTDLPVSIKLRASAGGNNALMFLEKMSDLKISAVMIHGRTLSQGFSGDVDYEIIKKARKYFSGVLLANGGAIDAKAAVKIISKTNADGVGIARGALGRPWIFTELHKAGQQISQKEIFRIASKHARLAEKLKGKQGIVEMRKHLCWYVNGLPNSSQLRHRLVQVNTLKEIYKILK